MTREEAKKIAEAMMAYAEGVRIWSSPGGEQKIGDPVIIRRSSATFTGIGYNQSQNTVHSRMRMNAGKK